MTEKIVKRDMRLMTTIIKVAFIASQMSAMRPEKSLEITLPSMLIDSITEPIKLPNPILDARLGKCCTKPRIITNKKRKLTFLFLYCFISICYMSYIKYSHRIKPLRD